MITTLTATIIAIESLYADENHVLLAFVTDLEIDAGGGCMENIVLNKSVPIERVQEYKKLLHQEINIELICKDFLLL